MLETERTEEAWREIKARVRLLERQMQVLLEDHEVQTGQSQRTKNRLQNLVTSVSLDKST